MDRAMLYRRNPRIEPINYVCRLTLPDGKVYIARSSKWLDKPDRWRYPHEFRQNHELYSAILDAGWENVEKTVIANYLTHNEAIGVKNDMIRAYDSTNPERGYNKTQRGRTHTMTDPLMR